VIIMGPPASGKTTLIPLILGGGNHAGAMTHVRPGKLFAEERAQGTPFGRRLDAFYAATHDTKPVPPHELFLPFIRAKLAAIESSGSGWLLEKGPRAVEHYQPWKVAGIVPDKVVVLEVDPEVVVARTRGRLQDPVTGQSYNRMGNMPESEEVRKRLVQRKDDVDIRTVLERIERFKDKYGPVMDLYERDLGPLKVRRFSTSASPAEIAASINAWLDEEGEMERGEEREDQPRGRIKK